MQRRDRGARVARDERDTSGSVHEDVPRVRRQHPEGDGDGPTARDTEGAFHELLDERVPMERLREGLDFARGAADEQHGRGRRRGTRRRGHGWRRSLHDPHVARAVPRGHAHAVKRPVAERMEALQELRERGCSGVGPAAAAEEEGRWDSVKHVRHASRSARAAAAATRVLSVQRADEGCSM